MARGLRIALQSPTEVSAMVASLQEETDFYVGIGWWDETTRQPSSISLPPQGGFGVLPSQSIHALFENDQLLDWERMFARTGDSERFETRAQVWADYYLNQYLTDLGSDFLAGCHTFGRGLCYRFERTADEDCRTAAIAIGDNSIARFAGAVDEWQQGYYGVRGPARQLDLACDLYRITGGDTKWRDHMDTIVGRLFDGPFWDDRGFFFISEFSTEAVFGATAASEGALAYSTMEMGALLPMALINYIETDAGARVSEAAQRMRLIAQHTRTTRRHANHYVGSFQCMDWDYVVGPNPGVMTDSSYDKTPPHASHHTIYSMMQIPQMVWRYLDGGGQAYLDEAVEYAKRGLTGTFNSVAQSQTNYEAGIIKRYLNSSVSSINTSLGFQQLQLADPDNGDLFYGAALPRAWAS